jgi:[ribosomal protein S5]-alanine N-acetyltransferase
MKKPYKHMPVIIFDDIMLRTITQKDANDMFDYGRNNEVVRFLSWGPFSMPKEAKISIRKIFYPRLKQGLPIGYAIVDLKTSKMIGTIDFHSKMKEEHGAEIGFVLHHDYWNQGIMTKALKKMIQVGFDHLGYDYIRIRHLGQNIASQKVIAKSIFKLKHIKPFSIEKSTHVINDDMYTYEITKEDYHVSQQSQGNI